MTKVTFIECLSCDRCVGGLTTIEAIKMWNAVVDRLAADAIERNV